jgi:4-amino-4-deoxy-L-arabinose transferase-like glycosyltransferase
MALTWWLRSPMHALPLERDEGAYAVIAVRWMDGEILYRDLFDHKPPLVYLVYGLARFCSSDPVRAIRTLATLYLLASGVVVLLTGWRLYGPWSAVAGLALFLAYGSSWRFQGLTFNSEAIMTLPAMLGCLGVVWGMQVRRPLPFVLAGMGVGLTALAKPVGVLLLGPLCLALLLLDWPWRRRLTVARRVLSAALLPTLVLLAYLTFHGALPAAYEALISYNRIYMRESLHNLANNPFWIWTIWKPMLALFGPGGAGVVVTLLVRRWRTPAHIVTAGWGAMLLLSALITVRDYPHYYLAAVPLFSLWAGALLFGLVDGEWLRSRRLLRWRWMAALPALVLLVVLVLPPVREIWPLRTMSPREQIEALHSTEGTRHFWAATEVASYLASRGSPDEPVFLWISEPQIYYLANLRPATRFVYDYPVDRLPRARDEVLRTLRQQPPRSIVTYHDVRPIGFYPFAAEEGYRLVATIGGFDVFERDPVSPSP